MSRRFKGLLRPHRPHHHADAPLAPYVNVIVGDPDKLSSVDFLIDTGTDFTILGPRDANDLLGDAYTTYDFRGATSGIGPITIGESDTRLVRSLAQLQFIDDDGESSAIVIPVGFVQPIPAKKPKEGQEHGNWLMPSLLGRDVLQHFDLHLSYHPPSVVLEEASLSG